MGEGNQIGEKKSFIDKYAKILVIVAVLCGATSGNFGVLITASPTVIGFWRLTIALPFFAIPILSNADKRKQLAQVSKKELLLSFISGAFLFLHYFTWYSSVKLTNVASAAVLASFAAAPLASLSATKAGALPCFLRLTSEGGIHVWSLHAPYSSEQSST